MPTLPSSEVKQPTVGKMQTADDINDLFKELDKNETIEKPEKKEKETKTIDDEADVDDADSKKRSKDEDDELELIEPEEDIEKLDLTKQDEDFEIETPPRKKEILKKYPELFKEFPFLEKVMYRDRQWNELFGSFDDAKELQEKSEVFNQFESQLMSGNTEQILREVKDTDEKAFKTIVDDYLPTLAKVDKEAYLHVTGNLNRRLIMEMVAEANEIGSEDLKQAALLVNQFVFGTAKFTQPSRLIEKKDDAEQSEAEQERLEYVKERFEASRDDLQSQVDNTLRATISDYIDPRNTMSSYVKKNAVADAMRILQESIAADPSVSKNLNNLWRAAFDDKFSKDKLGRIKSFYLSKAKANLKTAILKARAEALKDSKPSSHNLKETDEEETEEQPRQRRQVQSKPSTPRGRTNGPKRGQSVTEFFMED